MTTNEALELLKAGNLRFTQGSHTGHEQHEHRRIHTAETGQKPFAAVLACSDSRVPVEMLFDCGIGDIFVARVAGNVAGVEQLGSLEYAVAHLGVALVVVLGHSKCGAVTAVVQGHDMQGHIKSLAERIAPVVEETRRIYPDMEMDELLDECIRANVRYIKDHLTDKSVSMKKAVEDGSLKIIGAHYDIGSGHVDWD